MRHRRSLISISVVAVAAVSLFAAGCGGGGSSTPAASTTASTSARTGPLAFARCMRAHGLSGWPDPGPGGKFDKEKLLALGYPATQVRAVEDSACGRLLPVGPGPQDTIRQQRAHLADALSFARCMRTHGVTQFPDPNAQGELSVQMVQAQGIDVRSPAVLQTVQTCLPASHGALTAPMVRRALREAGVG